MYDYVRLCSLLIIVFHLVAPYLEIEHVWGAGGFPMIALPFRLLLAGAALLFLWPRFAEASWDAAMSAWQALRRRFARSVLFAAIAALSLPAFWLARLGHLRWGDAYIFAKGISHPEVRLTYSWQAPLDLYLHAKIWTLLQPLLGWDVQMVYAIISCLAGGFFVWVILRIASDLGSNVGARITIVALTLTLGSMQLFCGYVEAYTIAPVGIILFLWLGLRYLRDGGPLWPAALVLAVTHGLTPSTLPLLLSLLYLSWHAWRRRGWHVGRAGLQVVAPMLLVAVSILALMTAGGHGLNAFLGVDSPGGGDHRWLVPLLQVQTRWEHYTMFSWAHLRDFLNEQLLVAPLSLLLVIGAMVRYRRVLDWREPMLLFLGLAAGSYLLFTFIWNPDYGGRRDWDLFALASFPLTFLAAYLLNHYLPAAERARTAIVAVAVSLMHLLPWVHFNMLPWPWE
ncbi:MAG: hypothetical protein ACUVWR_09790 [Anaerolineae bacterium]